jgi:hypothetical protein
MCGLSRSCLSLRPIATPVRQWHEYARPVRALESICDGLQCTRRYLSAAATTYGNIVEWHTAAVSWMYHLFYNQMTGSWKSFSKTLFVCATLMPVSEQHTCPCSPPRLPSRALSKLASIRPMGNAWGLALGGSRRRHSRPRMIYPALPCSPQLISPCSCRTRHVGRPWLPVAYISPSLPVRM